MHDVSLATLKGKDHSLSETLVWEGVFFLFIYLSAQMYTLSYIYWRTKLRDASQSMQISIETLSLMRIYTTMPVYFSETVCFLTTEPPENTSYG